MSYCRCLCSGLLPVNSGFKKTAGKKVRWDVDSIGREKPKRSVVVGLRARDECARECPRMLCLV